MLDTSDSELTLLGLEGAARPYQLADVERALSILKHHRAVLLGHEPGLGKTLMSLLLARRLDAMRILIACPAVARLVWDKEVRTWCPDWINRLTVLRPGEPHDAALARKLAARDAIIVMSYDLIGALDASADAALDATIFGNAKFDLLIADEAHLLKTPGASRTTRIYRDNGLAARAKDVLLLTGTPTPNGPNELWSHFNALWPSLITIASRHGPPRAMTEMEWIERTCQMKFSKWGLSLAGVKNPAFVRDKLDKVMVRRTKREVLPELPRVIAADVPLDMNAKRLTQEARELNAKLSRRFRTMSDDAILQQLRLAPTNPDTVPLSTLRRQLAEMKTAPVLEWLCPRLDNDLDRKIVLFGWHRGVLDRLHYLLAGYSPVILTGGTSDKDRKDAIARFQNDATCRVFVGQLQACGTAVTLTAGTECAFVECAWTPGVNTQAISRLHRLGQRNSVLSHFLFVPDTLDEIVMGVFRRKAMGIQKFLT